MLLNLFDIRPYAIPNRYKDFSNFGSAYQQLGLDNKMQVYLDRRSVIPTKSVDEAIGMFVIELWKGLRLYRVKCGDSHFDSRKR